MTMEFSNNSFVPAKKLPQHLAALSACLGSMAAGAVLGWTANITEEMKRGEFNSISVDDTELGWIGSYSNLGALTLCYPIGEICDKIGRKPAMLLLTIPFMIGWLIIIFSVNLPMIYLGRFLTGMAGCAFCVSAPLYSSEIAQSKIRGALGSYFELLLTVGILFAYVISYCVDPKSYTAICAVLPILFSVAFFFQPETPVYLLKTGKDKEARKALVRLRGANYDVDSEMEEIQILLDEQSQNQLSILESFRKPATKRAALIAFGLMLFQQFSGINAATFYTSDIFESSGVQLDSKIATIIAGIMQVIATFISCSVVDKLGRRILLLGSGFTMAISACTLGIFFSLKDRNLVDESTLHSLGFVPVIALSVFFIAFSLGYGPIPWLISAEVFPPEVKTFACSVVGTFGWFLAFLVTKFYLDIKNIMGDDVTFYIFGGMSLLGTVFVLAIVPETKGKSLDEIQQELSGKKSYETRNNRIN